jgi:hypothetical protein
MTNTFALTDYDVYDDEENDDFLGMHLRRRYHKRRRKKRKQKRLQRRRFSKPPLGRPPLKVRPKIVRGRPMKLPPIKVRKLPIIVPRRKSRPIVTAIKVKKAPIVKAKTPISHLIRKTSLTTIKSALSNTSKAEMKQIDATQIEASKKAMESDGKTSKLVKVVAIVGVVGITGFGIYKFIQNKKLSN